MISCLVRGLVVLLVLTTGAGSDGNLTLTTNQTAVCLGDYYYLFCASQEPFGDMCGTSNVDWYIGTERIDTNNNTRYIVSTATATEVVLKFQITEDEFQVPQNFSCCALSCMSNVVSVGNYGPYPPVIGIPTVGTTWINLTWYHNESCCTNGRYMLLWQQWQSEGASGNMSMDNSSDHHLNITQLNPGTMYKVSVSVECQGHGLQNATVSINTTTISLTIAEATNDTVDTHPMLTAGQVLTLTCSAMGTPRPQIDWYHGDSRINTSSRVQINKSEFGDSTLVSTLVISSVTVGDAGTYECRVENIAGSTSLQYSVVVIGDGGDGGSGISGGAIAGIVVAGLVVIIISAGVVIAILAVLRKKMKKEENHSVRSGEKTVPTKPGATN